MERENFSSRFGSLAAIIGSAVGLGNIWRFPFLVGEYGSSFIFMYIVFVLLMGIPTVAAEFSIGRRSQKNAFGAFKKLAPGTRWKWAGALCVITPAIIVSYYSVIGGWSLEYLFKSLTFSFTGDVTQNQLSGLFDTFVSSTWAPLIFHALFLLIIVVVIMLGVKSGIEKFGKIMMPLLAIFLLAIAVYEQTLPHASEGLRYMFKLDFSTITPELCVAAMGQAFFSLSLGCGIMITYSSYLNRNDDLVCSSIITSFSDLAFALLASLAILPAVFSFGLDSAQGPSLVFQTLPFVFSKMPGGSVVAIMFFLGFFAAAITSAISLYEVVVAYFTEEKKLSRKQASLRVLAGVWLLGVVCSLSLGDLSGLRIAGKTVFDFCDSFSANILMTAGGFLSVIFVGWKMKKEQLKDELTNAGKIPRRLFGPLFFLIKYVAPIAILAIFITTAL